MGIIKGCLKVVGSAALVVTGTASTVLKGMSDAAGLEIGSELFGAAKDASFKGIRNMWSSETADQRITNYEINAEDSSRRMMADTAYKMAQTAQKNGDMEKYEIYMEKYQQFK